MARKLLFDPSKHQVSVDCIPEKIQGDGKCDMKVFNEVCVCNIEGRIFQEESQHRKFGTALQRNILNHWPNFRFTPSIHQVLAHSAALVAANESTGD